MGSSPPTSTAPHQVGHQGAQVLLPRRKRAKFSHGPVGMAPRLSGADRANSLSTERSGFITSGLTTGQMARQIPTLAIGCPHVGARGADQIMGSKASADCARRARSGFLLACWLRGFTFSLLVRFGVDTSKEDCNRWVPQQQQQRGGCRSGRRGHDGGTISGISPGWPGSPL